MLQSADVPFKAPHIKVRQYEHVENYFFVEGNPIIASNAEDPQSRRLQQEQHAIHVITYIVKNFLCCIQMCSNWFPSEDKVDRNIKERFILRVKCSYLLNLALEKSIVVHDVRGERLDLIILGRCRVDHPLAVPIVTPRSNFEDASELAQKRIKLASELPIRRFPKL